MSTYVSWAIPNVFVSVNGEMKLISSMVLSTISACVLIILVPQLMPLWMAGATGSRV